jgi:tRNA/rRNA methyltransferase
MNPLASIRVVLHRPSHPGNIGAAARAMKTMGFSRLVLVAPRRPIDDEARALSTAGIDVLESAKEVGSLEQALEGTTLAIAFSARERELSHPPLDARGAAAEVVRAAQTTEVALVFGNETAGLTNADILLCNRLAHIPSDPVHGSLNLAAAVQVVAYEVHMALGAPVEARAEDLATVEDVEQLHAHIERSLRTTGFLDPGKPKRLMERLRRLFARAQLRREEVNILRGMLTAWDDAIEGRKGKPRKGA